MLELKICGLLCLVIILFPYSWGKTLKDYPAECFTAEEIDDDTRLFSNYEVPTSRADDLNLKKGWYRIIGKGANSLKQGFDKALTGSKQSPPNFCGTRYAGTLLGEHPSSDQGIVEMTVCFRSSFCFYDNIQSCTCKYKKIIYVRNCLRHYIYWLSPTNHQARYCTDNIAMDGPLMTENRSFAVECNQYKDLDDTSRVWDNIADVKTDVEEGWFRFSKRSGQELSSSCTVSVTQKISRMAQPCGAAFRGYMPDRHPSLAEGCVKRRVCFSSVNDCRCEFFTNIAVRNCGSFFVYRLQPPPVDNSRYCGASKDLSALTDAKKPKMEKIENICNIYDVIHDPDRLWSYTSPTVQKCDAHFYGRYRFGSKYTRWSIKEGCNKTDMYVVTHRCGTSYQGFMEGNHPSVSEGYVERIICFQEASSPCECSFTTIVGVQNCSGFYVYNMIGVPRCHSRFCMVANETTDIRIDLGRPPMYGIPVPGHKLVVALRSKDVHRSKNLVVTTTVLSIILLIVLVFVIAIVMLLLFCIWPASRRKKQTQEKVKDSNIPLVLEDSNAMIISGSCRMQMADDDNGAGEPKNNNEDLINTSIPPRPCGAPSIEPPTSISQDVPSLHSDDGKSDTNRPSSNTSFPNLPEVVDEDELGDEEYDTLLNEDDFHKPGLYTPPDIDSTV